MANHALPTTTSLYTDVLTNLKDRIDDSLKMLDSVNTSPTNVPTNAIRWNSTTTLWEKYNGSSWISLAASYAIKVLKSTNLAGGNGTTLLGSIPYQSNTDTTTLLAPNTTTTRKFLRQTGTGTNGAAPVWDTILASDIPTLNQNTTGSSGSCTGNSATATKLATARTITLSGDVSGSATFDGSANITITAAVADGSHIHSASTITGLGTASVRNAGTSVNDVLPANISSLELGKYGSGDRYTFIDFISAGAPATIDYNARIIRNPGANGNLDIVNTGTGNITFSSSPIVPTPTAGNQAVNKDYVDTATGGEIRTTGTATFNGTTQNINLANIGNIALSIGDVIEVSGTTSNNKLFTVESITDNNNIVVNYEHRVTSTPVPRGRLINETASNCTIKLYNRAKKCSNRTRAILDRCGYE